MGNAVAYLMLLAWPAVCAAFFARLSVERALIWSILGAYMLLPALTELDLPLVPDLNKFSIPNVAVLLIMVVFMGLRPALYPRHRVTQCLMLCLLVGTIPTVLTNPEPIVFQSRLDVAPIRFEIGALPGLGVIDILSVMSGQMIMLIPFLLARLYLSTEEGLRLLTGALLIAGLVYSVPALVEIWVGPQLHVWVYGFFQHDLAQMIRNGGFRPIVFMPHALWLALFIVMAIVAAASLLRLAEAQRRFQYLCALVFLVVMIHLGKSLATQVYTLLLVPVVLLAPLRWQIRLAVMMAAVAVVYPMLRGAGLVPIEWLLTQAEAFDPDRAQSLGFRLENEEEILRHVAEKPLFGWGQWSRNLVYDPQTGEVLTIPDGRWILIFGSFGWFGYIAQMGLVAAPIVVVWLALRKRDIALSPLIGPLCLMLGITMMDLLLNDTMVPITWLIAGAILGYGERVLSGDASKTPAPAGVRMHPVMGHPRARGKRTLM